MVKRQYGPSTFYGLAISPAGTYRSSSLRVVGDDGQSREMAPGEIDELIATLELLADSQRNFMAAKNAEIGEIYKSVANGQVVHALVLCVDKDIGSVLAFIVDEKGHRISATAQAVEIFDMAHFTKVNSSSAFSIPS